MINDIKMGMKVIKYGLNALMTVIPLLICLVVGVLFDLFMPVGCFGGLYFIMGGMSFVQLIHSVSVSTMVQTSPHKKKLQTTIPAIIGCGYMVIANTISLLIKWVGYERLMNVSDPNVFVIIEPGEMGKGIVLSSMIMVFIMLYVGASLKCFWPATILFVIVFLGYYTSPEDVVLIPVPTGMAVILSYVIILIGSGLMCLIFKATYKLSYSKLSFETALKRAK